MNVKLQLATFDDADIVFELANQLHPSMTVARDEFEVTFRRLLRLDGSICIVAKASGTVVGYVSGCLRPVLIQGGNAAYIDEIVVHYDLRGGGIGTALTTEFEAWAKNNQCGLVGLATAGAKPFYEQLGYESRAGYFKKRLI